MIASAKPRKQRLFRYTAPMHVRQRFAHAHIDKELAKKLGIKRRSIEVRKGDLVMIMAGGKRGMSGRVSDVDLRKSRLFVEGVSRKTAKGKEIPVPISISNVYIKELDMKDELRKNRIEAMKVKAK